MSFALPTLTLLYLLTPGILFRRFYFTGEFSKQYFKATFSDLLISTILPSVLIQLASYSCVMDWYTLDTKVFSVLVSGTDDPQQINYALANIHDFKIQIVLYLVLTSSLGGLLGWISKLIVRKFKLDRRHKVFRFSNQWHYLFSGEILDYPKILGNSEDIGLRYVDILTDTQEGSVIYSGIVDEYILSKAGGMDSVYLSNVKRRYLKDDEHDSNTNPYYFLPGQFFIIPFSQIKNMHITYYSVTAESEIQEQANKIEPSEL